MCLWVETNNGSCYYIILAISEDFQQKVYLWNGLVALRLWIQIVKTEKESTDISISIVWA